MGGPVIRNPIPAWLRPENRSVLDSSLGRALQVIAKVIGADDPNSQVMGMVAPTGEVAEGPLAKAIQAVASKFPGIKAFHGSPHDFDQFSMSKIGTGEGAQAYGHGLYFAEKEGTAKAYRDALSDSDLMVAGQPRALKSLNSESPVDMAILDASNGVDRSATIHQGFEKRFADEYVAAMQRVKGQVSKVNPGRMYEVSINADPEQFLDWDKPLGGQSQAIQDLVFDLRYGKSKDPAFGSSVDQRNVFGHLDESKHTGRSLVDASGSDPITSEAFKNAGIPGIKYLDQGSRSAGEGTRNFVVFDDKLISIVKKYGIAGALAAGLINEGQARQLQAQGLP